MANLGTAAASTTSRIQLSYLPSVIHYAAATQFDSMKITVLGDGAIVDLDTDGLDIIGKSKRVTSDVGITVIPVANGLVGKNATIEIVNGAGVAVDIYGYSQAKATFYMRQLQQQILQGNLTKFANFAGLYIPDFDPADDMNITFMNGTNDKYAPEDLRALVSFFNQINNDDNDFYLDNDGGNIKEVSISAAAQRQAYYTKYQKLGNL